MKIKPMVERLQRQGHRVLVLELGQRPKIYYTEPEETFVDAFSQAMAEAARRYAIKFDVAPEQALEKLIEESAGKSREVLKHLLKEPPEANLDEARRLTLELTKDFDDDEAEGSEDEDDVRGKR